MTTSRIDRLLELLAKSAVNALALTPGPSLTYLTGLHFDMRERPTLLIVATGVQPALILPELEIGKARSAAFPIQTFTFGDNPAMWGDAFKSAASALALDGKRIGVEPTKMRFLELEYLRAAAPKATFESAEALIAGMRMIKDPEEIEAMRKAVKIAQDGLRAALPAIKPGVTEKDIADELFLQMLRAGSDPDMPFMPIVAAGPNSANPHAVRTSRKLQNGDLLVIDWGARFNGYCSDLTRTFAIGEVEAELRHVAAVVQQANEAGRAAAGPGKAAGEVDRAARALINAAGYAPYFFHRTGHGLGLEEHEPPYIFAENELKLQPGMSFTVEPGIYLADRGGVRIEDNVVITSTGSETLSDLPRELVVLPVK